jgi:hypothetical protein
MYRKHTVSKIYSRIARSFREPSLCRSRVFFCDQDIWPKSVGALQTLVKTSPKAGRNLLPAVFHAICIFLRSCGTTFELRSIICYKIEPILKGKKLGHTIASVSIKMSSLSDWIINSRRIWI